MNRKRDPESEQERSRKLRNLVEWAGLLGGPIAWLLNLQTTYALVQWACQKKHLYPVHVSSLFFFTLAILAGVVSWRIFLKLRQEAPRREIERQRFMVSLGMMTSALFALTILAQTLATFFINPCYD